MIRGHPLWISRVKKEANCLEYILLFPSPKVFRTAVSLASWDTESSLVEFVLKHRHRSHIPLGGNVNHQPAKLMSLHPLLLQLNGLESPPHLQRALPCLVLEHFKIGFLL